MASLFAATADNPQAKKLLLDLSIPHREVERLLRDLGIETAESSVRRYRLKYCRKERIEEITPDRTPVGKGSVDVDPDGATINNVVVESPILDDWSPVFKLFNLDPNEFEVVDDTVRMSTWQQSARDANGDRDTIQLWSYSARFRKVNKEMIPQAKVAAWADALLADGPCRIDQIRPENATGTTYAMFVADPQLGKKGTEEAVENWKSGVINHLNQIQRLRMEGQRIEGIHVAFMGDEHEGVANHYTNIQYTIELNRTQQMELDYDLSVWTLKKVTEMCLPVSVSSVMSNHGEWTRNDSKDPVTTRSDNSSTYVRRQVRKLFEELEPFGGAKIDWTIGDGAPGVVVNLSGVDTYFSHGYVEKGRGSTSELKVKNAIEQQILGRTSELGHVPLWFMAHYHHYYQWEDRGRAMFGCPALEAERSSEYMLDSYGVWSPPGMLGLLVGNHTTRKWSDLNIY